MDQDCAGTVPGLYQDCTRTVVELHLVPIQVSVCPTTRREGEGSSYCLVRACRVLTLAAP